MFVKELQRYSPPVMLPLLFLWVGAVQAGYDELNLTQGVTEISREVYDLHMLILWIVTVVGLGVFAVMFWSIFHHRKSRGAVAAKFHHSTTAEIIWTIIPIVILISMAVPATKTLIFMEETSDPDMTIKVTGYQWNWQYDYLEEELSFFSSLHPEHNDVRNGDSEKKPEDVEHYLLEVDNPMVIPINTKVRILTTAADVIHAWWVPDLGWKRDAIPGFINSNWTIIEEPGVYRGQCAELCGRDHGFMPVVVKAVEEEEYRQWVAQMKLASAEIDPEKSYNTHCAACHQANGQGIPGAFPSLVGSPVVTGPIAAQLNLVLNGKPGTAMQAFGPKLSDEEIAAIVTYQRTSWGNNASKVTAADVQAARQAADSGSAE